MGNYFLVRQCLWRYLASKITLAFSMLLGREICSISKFRTDKCVRRYHKKNVIPRREKVCEKNNNLYDFFRKAILGQSVNKWTICT